MSDNNLGESPVIAENVEATPEVETVAESAPAKVEAPEDRVQKRIDKLTKEKYAALSERDRLRWELEQARSQPAKTEQVAPELPTLEGAGFDESKYQTAQGEYLKALARAEAERIIADRDAKQSAAAKQTEFQKRQAEFIKSKPDYAEKVLENDSLPISMPMAEVIRRSDMGPQVAYYLAEHTETAEALASLQDPVDIAREIGRIEARLEAQKAAPVPKVSAAPPPPAKIEATDPAPSVKADSADSDNLSDAEWARLRNKQLARKR